MVMFTQIIYYANPPFRRLSETRMTAKFFAIVSTHWVKGLVDMRFGLVSCIFWRTTILSAAIVITLNLKRHIKTTPGRRSTCLFSTSVVKRRKYLKKKVFKLLLVHSEFEITNSIYNIFFL
jgi:hypothetical protein